MSTLRCGIIGLGAMGAPMARHLAARDYLEGVWNRTGSKAEQLAAELGCWRAGSPAALATRCDILLVCVSADADLESVVENSLPGLCTGSAVVDTSTVSPMITRKLAGMVAKQGVEYADAPVSGGVEGAINGRLVSMVGAELATFSRIKPVLESYSASVTHMGPVGNGQASKAVNQVIVAGVAEAVCEALALAEKLNLPQERLLSVLCSGAADGWFLRHRGVSMLENRFEKGFKQSLVLKDLGIVKALARELDIGMPVVEAAIRDYAELVAQGEGNNDISGLIRKKRSERAG
ncbi:MAG TPA: NAD(P)-dependent oxidoreductase [Xanthomonadales bacterium]|nr:NAD(P)-dependent oxidoreductase [Xanthomonadales bacterium]